MKWKIRKGEVDLSGTSVLVGILNVTPDSFSDGGVHYSLDNAINGAEKLLDEGAGIIDLGAESTRPGFTPVSAEEEIKRLVPVVKELKKRRPNCIISVDTSKADVAEAALSAGVDIINDVCGFLVDQRLAEVSARESAGIILMRNGRIDKGEGAIVERIQRSWEKSVGIAKDAGVDEAAIVLDPGVGFGTTRQEDLEILRNLKLLRSFGFPMLLGTSRKRITSLPSGLPLSGRTEPTIATTVAGIAAGVELFRVHDVLQNARAIGLADLIYKGGSLDE